MKPSAKEKGGVCRGLVENGLNWLGRPIDSFTSKYEEIDLTLLYSATSFEIFAKALVLFHQWQLVFSEPGAAKF